MRKMPSYNTGYAVVLHEGQCLLDPRGVPPAFRTNLIGRQYARIDRSPVFPPDREERYDDAMNCSPRLRLCI